jgi:hypothetical protein
MEEFERELTSLINKHNLDSISNTPDYIIAKAMIGFYSTLSESIAARSKWFNLSSDKIVHNLKS